ncbi:hypothetical protein IEQ34_007495 [Dendrobium chrysotoxum]|uniref:Glycosyltransferase N-terminal domain-containing protein n=1 Tax=Dendrobium chrysotoxum TaxID=161865 RepID=A0AAV7H4K8_DENCH|nr:hypothetical protein IEQ34_007495 [Dendrobium chrysotoxum]
MIHVAFFDLLVGSFGYYLRDIQGVLLRGFELGEIEKHSGQADVLTIHHTFKIYKCLDKTPKLSSPFTGEMSNADEVTPNTASKASPYPHSPPSTSTTYHFPPFHPLHPIPFPTHLQPLFDATDLIRSPLSSLFLSLSASSRRLVVIHDCLTSLDGFEAVAITNAVSYTFCGPSAAFLCEV